MTVSARLKTSVPLAQRERFAQLAAEQGMSISHLLARLIHTAVTQSPIEAEQRFNRAAREKAPVRKYSIRLNGSDAARLEARAQARALTASRYVAHLLLAHLRADPPMPLTEFEKLERVVSELVGTRAALAEILAAPRATLIDASLGDTVLKLVRALKALREKIQDTLVVNAKSWAAPDG